MADQIPILIDCDTGIDDSLALLYAVASPDAEIVAVTCCSGNVEAHQVAMNTLAVLELAGRTDIEVASVAPSRWSDRSRSPRRRTGRRASATPSCPRRAARSASATRPT